MKKPIERPKAPARMDTKTHHQTGYHKPVKNPTTNYPMDTHKAFCKRCMGYNGACPLTGGRPSKSCSI